MINETIDNGETEVQVATIGTVIGSTPEGEPIEQNFSEEALKKIAENQKEEILVDTDHTSETFNGDTSAKGWLSNLEFKEGKGLFGKIKWTDIGKKLIENRVFRWLSPSWILNADTKEPIEMTSCALTNKPSQLGRIVPIINSSPIASESIDIKENDMEDIIKRLTALEQLVSELTAKIEKPVENEEVVEEAKEKAMVEEKPVESEKSEETVNEKTIVVEEIDKEDKDNDKEIIKIDSLNSKPVSVASLNCDEWKNLKGDEFIAYCRKYYASNK